MHCQASHAAKPATAVQALHNTTLLTHWFLLFGGTFVPCSVIGKKRFMFLMISRNHCCFSKENTFFRYLFFSGKSGAQKQLDEMFHLKLR